MAPQDKVTYGFIAGEVSPDFYGRTDITKYEFGMRLCRNYFVDFAGGLKIRGGFEYFSPAQGKPGEVRDVLFAATVDDYSIEFSEYRIRIVRYGSYILETPKALNNVTLGNLVTLTAHGFANGDLLFCDAAAPFSKRYLEAYGVTANTFRLREVNGTSGEFFGNISGGSGTIARVYTVTSPYTGPDVQRIRTEQNYDDLIIAHKNYAPRKLKFIADNNWVLSAQLFGSNVAAPTGVTLAPSAGGSAGMAVSVTAVIDGEESQGSAYAMTTTSVNYTDTAGSLKITWTPVPSAVEYNVYRSLVLPTGADISQAQTVGFIGRALGPIFTDNNIVPDFTKTPPQFYNPFANRGLNRIEVTSGGTGYLRTSAVTVTDASGTGFVGYPVVNAAGVLLSVIVVNPGKDYVAPTITVSGGSGATFTFELGAADQYYPSLVRLFQQRMMYAATINDPMRVWASKPGTITNLDLSQITNAGDGYSYQLAAREVRPIQHLVELRQGILMFTSKSVILLRAEEGRAISGINALAEPQAYKGANQAEPAVIELDVIFAQRNSSAINAMLYTEYTNSFTLQDVALLSKHLFANGLEVTRFAWQSEPHKLLWCLRSDGVLLSLTYDREQEVFAWSQHATQGRVKDIIVLQERGFEVLYLLVERYLRDRWVLCRERMRYADVNHAEDWFGVDAGLLRTLTSGTTELFAEYTGASRTEIQLVASSLGSLTAVGDAIIFAEGRFTVTGVVNGTTVLCQVDREPTNLMHVTDQLYLVEAAAWQHATPITTLTNLWHLEGKTVSVNADGDGLLDYVVTDGQITLPAAVVKVAVGLQYVADVQMLSPVFAQDVTEALSKDIVSAHIRLNKTRGIEVGHSADSTQEMKDFTEEDWGDPLALRNDFPEIIISAPWAELGGLFIRQRYPLPAHILSLVQHIDLEG